MGARISIMSLWLCCACAGSAPAPPAAAEVASASSGGETTVAARDASGDLILSPGARSESVERPRWLAGLRAGDVLIYRVSVAEGASQLLRYDVARLEQRGRGVAALFVPRASQDHARPPQPYWLVGDEEALYRLERHPDLQDPGFTPLDDSGRVISELRTRAQWQLPPSWSGKPALDPQAQGWVVEELSMKLEGPVRGDRCMQVVQRGEQPVRIAVCGDVGIVEVRYDREMAMGERWELVEIRRE